MKLQNKNVLYSEIIINKKANKYEIITHAI